MNLKFFGALALATCAPVAVSAQTAPAPVATPAVTGHYTTSATTIDTLLADPAAKAVVEKHFPGLTTADSIKMAGNMTLHDLQQFKADMFTDKALSETDADLAKLPAK